MALFKKNLWSIFYILSALFTLYFIIASCAQWQKIFTDAQKSQENSLKLIANATESLYKTNEIMLDILGHRFLEDLSYQDNKSAMNTLNRALEKSPAIISIALVNPQGDMLFATNELDVSNFPNLLEQPQSRESFKETLQTDAMVFGRPYFFEPFQDWIVPIRKTIRNKDGSVYRVITAALRLEESFGHLVKNIDQKNHYISLIVRKDMYVQYSNNTQNRDFTIYQSPLDEEMQKVIAKRGNGSELYSFVCKTKPQKLLTSVEYNDTYKLWFVLMTKMENIWNDFAKWLGGYFLIFICVEGVLYYLFRIIARAEEKRNADLLYQATHDQLTNLYNRNYLKDTIGEWIYPKAPSFSMLYIDLDNFKNINDSFGHYYGDMLLVELVKRLGKILSEQSVLIRHGGDEFIVLTRSCEAKELLDFGKHLIQTISKPYNINGMRLHVGASMGVAIYPQHGQELDDLLRSADIAMYKSKRLKNSVHIFEDTMQEGYLYNVKIEQAMRSAMENREFFMVYQPQVYADGGFYGVEALARWNSPTLGTIPPDIFIPVAEASGQMPSLGRYIIEATFADIKQVQQLLGKSFRTSINLSTRQLLEPDFAAYFIAKMKSEGIESIWATLEITESLFIEDIEAILPLLHELKSHGVQLSMDDFGTGYSSLNMLRMLPIDELKIDKSFIDAIMADKKAQQMIQSIITIGKNLEMDIVAEGIETKEQMEVLANFGCDRFQGYYFSRPISKEELAQYVKVKTPYM